MQHKLRGKMVNTEKLRI